MVNLENFGIVVKNNNAKQIVNYLRDKTPIINVTDFDGTAGNGCHYFVQLNTK